jgi:hypothetical protein
MNMQPWTAWGFWPTAAQRPWKQGPGSSHVTALGRTIYPPGGELGVMYYMIKSGVALPVWWTGTVK